MKLRKHTHRSDDFQDARAILRNDYTNLGLLIGNGINRSAEGSGGFSWDQLMQALITEAAGASPDPLESERRLKKLIEPGKKGETPASLPETFDIIEAIRAVHVRKEKKGPGKSSLQASIVRLLGDMEPGEPHRKVVKWARRFGVPLLTTNYDHCLQNALNDPRCKRKAFGGSCPLNEFYPWDRYYASEQITDPVHAFAIWHIHGDQELLSSIRVGLDQYMGMVERLRELKFPVAKEVLRGLPADQDTPAFHKAPWLRVFMGKKLWIQGLGLRAAEVPIRWLLIQRFRYWRRYLPNGDAINGWYVHGPTQEVGPLDRERKIFFESVGLKIISIAKPDDLYVNLFRE